MMLTSPQPPSARRSPRVVLRRLLVVPALALLLLGIPVLAVAQTAPPPATTEEVPIADGQTVDAGWTSAPTPVDANLVGVTWDGDRAAEFTIEVQHANGTWSKATDVDSDVAGQADEGTADAISVAADPTIASEPLWIGGDATAVRVSLTSGQASDVSVAAVDVPSAPAPNGSAGALGDWLVPLDGPSRYAFAAVLFGAALVLLLVGLGWSPWRSRRNQRLAIIVAVAALVAACAPVSPPGNGSSMPGIYSRSQWGARPFKVSSDCNNGVPQLAPKLKFAVVHHTAGSNNYSAPSVASILRGIQAYHMDANGFCDIAYNFAIDKYGGIWEARAGGMNKPVIGGHSGGFNSGSTGVMLLGTFTNGVYPSTAAWNSLVHLLRWRMSIASVHPKAPFTHTVASSPCNCQNWPPGTTVTIPVSLVGHRDLDQTACPGNLWGQLGALRDQVAAGYVPPTTTSSSTTSTTGAGSTAVSTTTTSSTLPPSTTTSTSTP